MKIKKKKIIVIILKNKSFFLNIQCENFKILRISINKFKSILKNFILNHFFILKIKKN